MLSFVTLLKYRTISPFVRLAHHTEDPLLVPPRYIYDHEFILIREGAGTIFTEDGEFNYSPNSLLMIPPKIVHSFQDKEDHGNRHTAVHFDLERRHQAANTLFMWGNNVISHEDKHLPDRSHGSTSL